MITKVANDRQGIQSVEVGFSLLRVIAANNRPMMLRDIAKGAGMPAAKAHRYMVSFMRIGIVEQDPATGRYDLGAYALDLGLSGLGRLDPVLTMTRRVYDAAGNAVEFGDHCYRADRYSFDVTVHAS